MFGTNFGGNRMTEVSRITFMDKHFAFLETEQDDLTASVNNKAWNVHGLNLLKEVLERILYKKSEELLARPLSAIYTLKLSI